MFPHLTSKIVASLPATKPFMTGVSFDFDKIFHDFEILLFKRWNSLDEQDLEQLVVLVEEMRDNLLSLRDDSPNFNEPLYFSFQKQLITTYYNVVNRIYALEYRDVKDGDSYEQAAKIVVDIDRFTAYLFGTFYVNDTDSKIAFSIKLWSIQEDIKLDTFKMIAIATIKYAANKATQVESTKDKILAATGLLRIIAS